MGGDEVGGSCWEAAPHIVDFMKKHNFTVADLQNYYETKMNKIVTEELKMQPIYWEDVFDRQENNIKISKDAIINTYKNGASNAKLVDVVKKGF